MTPIATEDATEDATATPQTAPSTEPEHTEPETAAPASAELTAEAVQAAPRKPDAPAIGPVLERLFELYPKLFGGRFVPLKLGVFHELLALHPEAFNKAQLKAALAFHARSTRYLECVAAGLPRHDLSAQALEPVAPRACAARHR